MYSKYSFGEVHRRIYGRKFSFTATCKRRRKTGFPAVYPMIYLQNENFEYGYPHSNAFLQFRLKLEHCKPQKAARHPTICDVINDVKLFPTGYTVANF